MKNIYNITEFNDLLNNFLSQPLIYESQYNSFKNKIKLLTKGNELKLQILKTFIFIDKYVKNGILDKELYLNSKKSKSKNFSKIKKGSKANSEKSKNNLKSKKSINSKNSYKKDKLRLNGKVKGSFVQTEEYKEKIKRDALSTSSSLYTYRG